jgi:hypothetical protein
VAKTGEIKLGNVDGESNTAPHNLFLTCRLMWERAAAGGHRPADAAVQSGGSMRANQIWT